MAYELTDTFYQLRRAQTGYHALATAPADDWIIEEVLPANDITLVDQTLRRIMRGTFSQCKTWLDNNPGSAISIAEGDA